MHSQPGPRGGKIERFFRKPGTGHSPQRETEIQLPDEEKLADDVEAVILRTRRDLTEIVRHAAHHTLKAIIARPEGAGTGQLADLAYAFACLEGARRGVLPGSPPPPKNTGEPPSSTTSTTAPRGAAQWGTDAR